MRNIIRNIMRNFIIVTPVKTEYVIVREEKSEMERFIDHSRYEMERFEDEGRRELYDFEAFKRH